MTDDTTLPPTKISAIADRRKASSRWLGMFVGVSFAVHSLVFAVWMWMPHPQKSAIDLDDAVVKARLVKLGKPRDEKLLPRLPTSAPPPPVDKKAVPTPDKPVVPDKPAPVATEKASAADILERFKTDNARPKDINDLIKNRIGEDTDEGQADGDKEGSALEGQVTDSYFARVTARIQQATKVSSVITDEEKLRLRATLCLKIDGDGRLGDIKIGTSSGSPVYDSDVMSAARTVGTAPAPPPPARRRAAEGVCFEFCPLRCR